MKNKVYYIILVALLIATIACIFVINLKFTHWIWIAGATVWFIWCKDVFTNQK